MLITAQKKGVERINFIDVVYDFSFRYEMWIRKTKKFAKINK